MARIKYFLLLMGSLWCCFSCNMAGPSHKVCKDIVLQEVDVFPESSAAYYRFFKLDHKLYNVSKHKDRDLFRVEISHWNGEKNKLQPLEDGPLLFEDSMTLFSYLDTLFLTGSVEEASKELYEDDQLGKAIQLKASGYDILQQSKAGNDAYFFVLRNALFYIKVVFYDRASSFYKEVYYNENPHNAEWLFLDVDGDGTKDVIQRDFYLYDAFDVYDGSVMRLTRCPTLDHL